MKLNNKILGKLSIILSIISIMILSCSNNQEEIEQKEIDRGGALIDKIIYEVRTDMTIAIKDVAAGRADLMASGIDGSTYLSLGESDLEKLDTYAVPSGSWSLLFNPVPNKAPYTVTTRDGKTYFNPLAIKEVRFAMNFLIDRKKLVDEILRGAGEPSFTQATPGQPGTYRYNLIPSKMGMTANGNEEKAISDINKAMEKASNLPENRGKLKKENGWWKYNGETVTIKFVIRVDDPTGRLPAGNAISDLIEKTGIKVEKLLYDRNKSTQVVYGSDPKDYEWNIITEAWGAGATRAWWDVTLRQMYVREGNYMPGGNISEFWNYDNREASRISDKNSNGWFLTADEYWNGNMRLQEIGLEDAVRIYLNSQTQFFVANKERFNRRMLYGVGDGINDWSIRSADIKPNRNGEKVLRVLQHSAQGSLFISPWDPVGVGGFSDAYSSIMIGPCSDAGATFESPSTAKTVFILGEADTNSLEIGVKAGNNGIPVGTIKVPQNAKMYNPYTQKWEEGLTVKVNENGELVYQKSDNLTAYVKCDFKPRNFKWHHGIESSLVDLMYGSVFIANVITKTNENDKYYDSAMAGRYLSAMDGAVGSIINEDGSFTLYGNYYWPMDMDKQIAIAAVSPKIGNPNRNTVIPFEINEAIMKIVLEGSKSGNVYTISQDQSLTSIDVKNPTCVSDIKEKLIEMRDSEYIPAGIEDFITKEDVVKRYQAAIDFIEKYGHAYISNGPFFISRIDSKANYIELTAFKDYSYTAEYWIERLSTKMSRIEDIDMPAIANRNNDINIDIYVSSYNYPDNALELPDPNTTVKVLLQLQNGGEREYKAVLQDDVFKLAIPKEDLSSLPRGNYIVVVESYIADETPYIETRSFALQ
ncbi:ABC transporter substrate-binding protein [Brachyspira hampsonii]|uniref:ABC transporter substrate-binding protein n=1 Tax=Brachyspira hampsonii TaxID=1287055 RepID=UPI000D349E6E|nr:ABC transporter substrate-binding protein [Brachyspira hampsonii]PTY40440.1 ABC transporter substrate-binding protein [Brachyspira hampsonii bv. II]